MDLTDYHALERISNLLSFGILAYQPLEFGIVFAEVLILMSDVSLKE